MTSHIGQEAGRTVSASSTRKAGRPLRVGIAAALLLTCSPLALHADTSNAELAKEIAELKAQIREMKGAISSTRSEVRRVKVVSAPAPYAPAFVPPPGAIPAFVTADKKLLFGGITITPGGFIAAESVFRSKTTQSDINTGYGAIPFGNNANAHTNELRLTGRQSRAALLVEGAVTPSYLLSAYGEFDFLGAGTTSNATDTNSYAPRIRQLTVGLDNSDYGMHVLGGQMYSLLTLNSKGITPRNEVLPPVIDGQFIPGTIFARQAAIRLVKDFNKKLWIGISAEESQTTFNTANCGGGSLTAGGTAINAAASATAPNSVPPGQTVTCGSDGSGAGFSQYGQPYSYNHIPDIIGKVAYEATFADRDIHFEADGIYRNFYDRVAYAAAPVVGTPRADQNTTGFGFGGGVIVPIIPKKLDFQGNALAGTGIGRYGAGLLNDTTFNTNGSLRPIKEIIASAGLTFHATPSIDIYGYAGFEKQSSAYTQTAPGTYVGYGIPNVNDSGCAVEGGICNGQNKALYQLTGGFWDKVYKGSFGEVRAGMQYSFTRREFFATPLAAGATAVSYSPHADENMIFTSLRYYPFQ